MSISIDTCRMECQRLADPMGKPLMAPIQLRDLDERSPADAV